MDVGACFFVYLLVQTMVASALVQVVFHFKGVSIPEVFAHPSASLWIMIAGSILGLFFVTPFSWRSGFYSPEIWSWGSQHWSASVHHLGVGVFTWVIAFPLVALVNQGMGWLIIWITGQNPQDQTVVRLVKTSETPLQWWLVILSVTTLIPIIEEILFRGFLQSYFRRRLGVWCSIGLSSLCFSLFHYSASQSWGNSVILSSLFILGLFLGYLYERQRSLWAPIGLHMTFNAISLVYILAK